MKVSVVICTKDRAHAIVHCLQSIDAAARAASLRDAEIVVVDNASIDDTEAVLHNFAADASIPVRVECEPRTGIAIAKNRGLRTAQGDILVLIDDDCRLQRDYFVELVHLHATDKDLALRGGRVELGNAGDLSLTIKTDTTRNQWHIKDRSARYENLGNCFLGCNLFVSRMVYERLGPMDELFGVGSIPAGEDTDYIFRAYTAGIKLEYMPNIVVYHHHGRQTSEAAQRLWRSYMIGSGALYAKYLFKCPDLCRQAPWDLKGFVRETLARENRFLPEYDFSYADKMRCYAAGASSYLSANMRVQGQNRRSCGA
ncbi:glycosyltransferase family 2 protein [Bradyrhizobium sp.]|uniref:glycosyltransferase family 2 protein n=1 Tax=Bradyrhizobium sp. TaxID=376 RepID=UPI001E0E274E|nr:glycosyltransferase [Bradyrhizobium sp.]MBV8701943.1 glycosyltransferase [Bradyrhizobium sp.]MBV8920734.1 glycosyltransferase [Bradyrhizobium sp.]MBV9983508.1 glycosyltransferase [Bradyrhizobium sp.]